MDLGEIDWPNACLEVESLLENSDALLNRQRIMDILYETRTHLLQIANKKQDLDL